ncbi:type I-F CRISPR-associated endoribonuclease Cas6/Csy4 [Klebsiella oxytoca]|uniref:type I-F CRISPR-associated endoribonuclease Cas6/Csy4 n=1 Tax=Klebsiella oxytoca TaxID=571 RepID=UPI00357106FE
MRQHAKVQIGVSFPDWNMRTPGRSIAFVSTNRSVLEAFRHRSYFQMMEEAHLFSISQVLNVPEACMYVRFVRNQNVAKIFPGERKRRLERAKRRANERGEFFHPHTPAIEREIDFFHSIFMQSSSNGHNYVLHIQKQAVDSVNNDTFNSYGLASNQIHKGCVPELYGIVSHIMHNL